MSAGGSSEIRASGTRIEKVEIREPVFGYTQEFLVLPVESLRVIEVQRKPSEHHVKRLVRSMKKVGFIVPLIVVRGQDNTYSVIDGQHRLLAAKELGIKELPCIVVPSKYAYDLMELNVEKQMSLREKAYVSLNVYNEWLRADKTIAENDTRIMDSLESIHFVTLGMAYSKQETFFGSAYESILRRVDFFLAKPLEEASQIRQKRAETLLEIDTLVRQATQKVEELGVSHPFLYKEVVSFCNPIGRKRKVSHTFESAMQELRRNVEELIKNPEKIREHQMGGAESYPQVEYPQEALQ